MYRDTRSRLASFFLGDALPEAHRPLDTGFLRTLLTRRPGPMAVAVGLGIASACLGLLAPWQQKKFVDGILVGENPGSLAWTMVLAFCAMFASQALLSLTRVLCMRESTLAQRWVSTRLYEHTLALDSRSRAAPGSRSVGETVALYAQDVLAACNVLDDVVPNLLASLIPLVAAPIAISLVHDVPLWPPVLVSVLSVATCLAMSKRQARLFGLMKVFAERRLSIVNEWLQNMRALRVLGWIGFFERRILGVREEESRNRLAMVTNGSTMNSIAQVAPFLVNVAGVLAFLSATKGTPTPGDVFSLLWIFGIFLVRPIRMLPWAIVVAVDAATSSRRLESFFALSAEAPEADNRSGLSEAENNETLTAARPRAGTPDAIVVEGLTLKEGERHLLYDVNFRVEKGELVAIIGEVGSGKTLLLQALLRETSATFGSYHLGSQDALAMGLQELRRHFGYVPQDSFVMSASLRDNVSFEYGSPDAHEAGVLESLRLADFRPDCSPGGERFEEGLRTEIGERGVNLSGGQRQRVNLARAHFHGREVLLLDDALSALDTQTEARVRRKLLQGAWRNRTRLLVTHRLSILAHCDRVFFMEDGLLKETGTFDELLARSDAVRAFVRSMGGVP